MTEPVEFNEQASKVGRGVYENFLSQFKKPLSGDIDIDAFGKKIAPGWDSDVFYFKDQEREYVLKFYKQNKELLDYQKGGRTLQLYSELTNQASDQFSGVVKPDGIITDCEIVINPILGLVWSEEYNCWVSVCPFVEGIDIQKQGLRQVGENEERAIKKELTKIQEEIGNQFNVNGIKIIDTNCLWAFDEVNQRVKIAVVDLCPSLNLLEERSSS